MGTLKTGDEHIRFDGMPTGYLLSDFWRWSSSDLLDNTLRGTFSEFIVGTALDLDLTTGFENWLLLHTAVGAEEALQHHLQHPPHCEMGAGWTPL